VKAMTANDRPKSARLTIHRCFTVNHGTFVILGGWDVLSSIVSGTDVVLFWCGVDSAARAT